ncbi:hypothetical protein [Streptomyces hydrogenans]|uniref:hypothetical protein n=1 Tax=Streptomyces hydrogenans TaxID=1873719 RepID=UPI00367C5DBD
MTEKLGLDEQAQSYVAIYGPWLQTKTLWGQAGIWIPPVTIAAGSLCKDDRSRAI